jgi:DsbC/DsbD-like thiol-disulfide interchange protein
MRHIPLCRATGWLAVAGAVLTLALGNGPAGANQGKKSDSVVKVSATADKPDAEGKQTVTVTLLIDKGWHTYANPVGQKDFPGVETTLTVTAKQKPQIRIDYPKGTLVTDPQTGNYFVYEDRAVIKAVVQRAKGDTSPLELSVKFQACTKQSCLLPATVKLTPK